MNRTSNRSLLLLAASALSATAPALAGGPIIANFGSPTTDRWMYPFNASPGTRPTGSTFGNTSGEPEFDNRDGQIVLSFNTQALVPAQQGAANYTIQAAVLELEVSNDLVFQYDNTQDPYTAFLAPSHPDYTPDADAGQPIECHATGFRNGWSAATFYESAPYCPGSADPLAQSVRNAFAAGANPDGSLFDVSNNVREEFDATPFAIGTIAGLQPGDFVPAGLKMRFALNVADPGVQAYLRNSLDGGVLFLSVTSLTFVEVMGGSYPSFTFKENALIPFGLATAATLQMEVQIGPSCVPADLDCNGIVDGADLGALLGQWGSSGTADLDKSGTVDGADLGALLGSWG